MKVNLSRIHNILQQLTAEVRAKYAQAMRPLQAGDFSFKILEGTTDADLDEFMGKLKKKKHDTEKLFADTRRIIDYDSYLRRELDKANRESGVSEKLLEVACMQRVYANMAKVRDIIEMSCSEDLDPRKGADYYKSSFTDTNRQYELLAQLFSANDMAAIEKELEAQNKAINALKDDIALTNQTTVIEIMSFEEFCGKK